MISLAVDGPARTFSGQVKHDVVTQTQSSACAQPTPRTSNTATCFNDIILANDSTGVAPMVLLWTQCRSVGEGVFSAILAEIMRGVINKFVDFDGNTTAT